MSNQTAKNKQVCPREEILLYLDGELSASDELVFEKHLEVCSICHNELNSQKQMFLALNLAFEDKTEIELPKDFAKVVVINAESNVNGLRSRKERSSALFIGLGLILLALVGLSVENERLFGVVNEFGKQIFTIVGFIFRLTFDFTAGLAVVLRSLSQHFLSNTFLLTLIIGIFIISLFALSRIWLRFTRF